MNKIIVSVVAACLLFAAPVMAKEGFYAGVFYPMSTISGDAGSGTSSGNGWGVRAGLGLSRYLALEADYAATKHDVTGGKSMDLKGLAGDLKLHFPLTSLDSAQVMTLEPYLLVGYGHFETKFASTTYKSNGLQYGVGLELYLFRELSVNAGWTKTSVSFDTTPKKTDGDVKTVDFGITYHFI